MSNHIRILFGTHPIHGWSEEKRQEFLKVLKQFSVKGLDTAYIYEAALGALKCPSEFIIHTKAPGFKSGCLSKDSILAGAKKSFEELGTDHVETYFLHSPDPETPIEETMEAIQELYKAGRFEHFGLSNFEPSDVSKIHQYASSKGYVVPTVYQGNYNPVARHSEDELFPLLRKLGMRFYAYSPLAGGFLVKTAETIRAGGEGHLDASTTGGQMYNKPKLVEALNAWEKISQDSGISKSQLAYRWVTYNSQLATKYQDGIIVGASRPEQLKETLEEIEKGPLPEKAAEQIEHVWQTVKDEAPIDNYAS
ncbi:NADP-dependent oxidoreductase domain-containing protein [Cryomyces antarcticus]